MVAQRGVELWGVREPIGRRVILLSALVRLGLVAVVSGTVIGAAVGLLGAPVGLAAAAAAVVAGVLLGVLVASALGDRRVVRRSITLDRRHQAMVAAVVEGVEPILGLGATQVAVLGGSGINAALLPGNKGEPLVLLTEAAVRELDSLELEALIVRTLVPWRLGLERALALSAFADRLFRRARRREPWHVRLAWELDVAACALTRYPPAVVSLLRRAATQGSEVPRELPVWVWLAGGDNAEELVARADALEDEPWATRRNPVDQ